jgi:hypothetical protein
MSKPIYKLFVSRKLDTWYKLSPYDQQQLIRKLDEAFERAGGKRPILLNTSWHSDRWHVSGVEEFPDIESVENYMNELKEMGWSRFCESKNILGTDYHPTFDSIMKVDGE